MRLIMNTLDSINLDGKSLTIKEIDQVSINPITVQLSEHAYSEVEVASQAIQRLAESDHAIYGVNTGFGIFADNRVSPDHASEISRNLILSHAVAVGDTFPLDVTRAAMIIRANTLSRGHSGVRPAIIEVLLEMLNKGVTPLIPSQGSLGSSGDLAYLAHLVLVLADILDECGQYPQCKAVYKDKTLDGIEAMKSAGIGRPSLGPKEGLALINGATFSAALTALALAESRRLLHAIEIATAMTYDALLGVLDALDPRIHEARSHTGQIQSAQRILGYLENTTLAGSSGRVQDAYSLRCSPQIIGPAWEALEFSSLTITREVNATTDNPLLFGDDILSGGNFHGQPIGMVADLMKIAMTEVGNLSERRTYRLLAAHTNAGLTPMLISDPANVGLYSGLMMLQYTAASLCLENQALATPASIRSLPTSAGQEDHNANAATAARHLADIVRNLLSIVAVELICASQAIELRLRENPDSQLGAGTQKAFDCIRQVSSFIDYERPLSQDIVNVANLIHSGRLLAAVDVDDAML
jgi:histidine ammonia-lyase